jgi:hypothetical protein
MAFAAYQKNARVGDMKNQLPLIVFGFEEYLRSEHSACPSCGERPVDYQTGPHAVLASCVKCKEPRFMVSRGTFDELMQKNLKKARGMTEYFKLLESLYPSLGADSASQKP